MIVVSLIERTFNSTILLCKIVEVSQDPHINSNNLPNLTQDTASSLYYGPRPLKSILRHGNLLNLICDIMLSDMRNGSYKCSDMGRIHFLKSTYDIGDTPSRAPILLFWNLSLYIYHNKNCGLVPLSPQNHSVVKCRPLFPCQFTPHFLLRRPRVGGPFPGGCLLGTGESC